MEQQVTIYEPQKAVAVAHRGNYLVNIGNRDLELKRGVDFDNPDTRNGKKAFNQPILLKAGAEKLAFGFGLCQRYTIESKIEQHDENGMFFYYLVRCDLVKPNEWGETVLSNSYGSANTAEKRNGFNSAADAANSTLKMAQKRALVGAALAISGLSDMFTQDIENETFMRSADDIVKEMPDSPVTTKQIRRLYAIASEHGMNQQQAKQKLAAMGYTSTKDIKQKDYDAVCDALAKEEK
mgnify:FL=1